MPSNHTLNPGWIADQGHWVECQSCGFEFRAYDIQKRWDGLYVCKKDFEYRHPQELIKVPNDQIAADQPINIPGETFTDVTFSSALPPLPDGTFDIDLTDTPYPSGFDSGFDEGFGT